MEQPVILHIETATSICSVALSRGKDLLSVRESSEDKSHGSLLTVFMEEVMKEAGISPSGINAVAVSKGPGSYTGLRIGVSATKGFAYARNIPVIGVATLEALSLAARDNEAVIALIQGEKKALLAPLIDARRMEVYSAIYTPEGKEFLPVAARILNEESFNDILADRTIIFFGNGSDKAAKQIRHPNAHFLSGINPSARHMIPLAYESYIQQSFEDSAYFEPFYLKDFIATIPKKKIL